MTHRARPVNNAIYATLGESWYQAQDNPIALLRAESALLTPWVASETRKRFGSTPVRLLDVGCGGGFLTNALAKHGHHVTGLDASSASLEVAARHDDTRKVRYVLGDARQLTFPDAGFDVVTAMDFLEHVEDPAAVIREVARVLAPGGSFVFHTFNRNPIAWLVAIKGVEWFVRNSPSDLHVLRLFRKPQELRALCAGQALSVSELHGLRPVLSWDFMRLLATRRVPRTFAFRFTRSTLISYAGIAHKALSPGF